METKLSKLVEFMRTVDNAAALKLASKWQRLGAEKRRYKPQPMRLSTPHFISSLAGMLMR
jgi:hypothetical protein